MATESRRQMNTLNPRLIKQSMMLTFSQPALLHVSAVTMAGGSSGEVIKTAASVLLCNTFLSMQRKGREEMEGVKRRISKQMRYAVSKQRTMESGLTVVLSARTGREKRKKRGDHHSH